MLYLSTFLLGFCSIVYELLLGQSLSAFLGNTVLRYSVTIGLYMLSMGVGARLAEGRWTRRAATTLVTVEILLTVVGGFSVIALLSLSSLGMPGLLFATLAHLLIVGIGILTGMEIPLLIALADDPERSERTVLGVDYLGAFVGTLAFAFLFYPTVGLVPTAFSIALLNALVGVGLYAQRARVEPARQGAFRTLVGAQGVLAVVLVVLLQASGRINELFLQVYLGS